MTTGTVTTGYLQVFPNVPPHICPGRRRTCPDCGQEFYTPPYPSGPIWIVPTPWLQRHLGPTWTATDTVPTAFA